MRARRCTIDSSCVIALDHLELVPLLSVLFSIVLMPKAVREDLFKRRATKDRLQFLFESYDFQRCDGYEQGTVDFLLAERARQGAKDRGEVEAVVQASHFGATVIVDDPWGRELAARYDLECHGTLWILRRFYNWSCFLQPPRGCFVSLRLRGTRLPWATLNAHFLQIGQPAL